MTDKEFFVHTLKDEIPRFERVFKALPHAQMHWQVHPNSRSTQAICMAMISEGPTFPMILKNGTVDVSDFTGPKSATPAKMASIMTKYLKETEKIADKMTQSDWEGKAVMTNGGKIEWTTTKGKMIWGFLLDLIHHRGQLSVHIRPMGGKVPSIYGPSGDQDM